MPADPDEFRIAPGWISRVALDATSAYQVTQFTRQSDMLAGRQWVRPDNMADVIKPSAVYVESMDSHVGGYGGKEFTWGFQNMTPLMVMFLRDTYFAGGDKSALATVKTWDRTSGAFEYFHCIAHWPNPVSEAAAAAGGFSPFPIRFVDADIAPISDNLPAYMEGV